MQDKVTCDYEPWGYPVHEQTVPVISYILKLTTAHIKHII